MSILKLFQPIASAFAPNYTIVDVLIAWKYVFLPWKWGKLQEDESFKTPHTPLLGGGRNFRKLERKFCEYMEARWAVSFDSGRSGLYAILKCMGIKDYDEVILQAFTTVALPNAILWCGAKPIYIDIKEKTYNIDPEKIEEKITEKTRAIVVQHTFGNPADMDEIMEIAKKHDLFVIEDCAHSLGAEYKNKKTGTFGDAAFFSFGRDKVISSVAGGMVITNNGELSKKIKEFRDQMPYPEKSLIIRQLLHPVITFMALKSYYFLGIGKILMFLATNSGILTKAYGRKEKNNEKPDNFPAKMTNALAEIALHQFNMLSRFNEHRINIANIYNDELKNIDGITVPETLQGSKNIFLWYTILAEDKSSVISHAKKEHIILGDWFPKAIGPIETDLKRSGYDVGSCPVAENVSSKCINLPTNRNTDHDDAFKIIRFIREQSKIHNPE
ncbi:MAG: DegT/DnrJ/EryC1/StrS family aminotransferase [Minisyncoccia bacterium]